MLQTAFRTHHCGELSLNDLDKEVTLCGWIQTIRKFGSITFIDLRDRYGITQLLVQGENYQGSKPITNLGREFVIQATGKVVERSNKNMQIATGEIEILIENLHVLNAALIPPFTIQDDTDGGDELRMQYRFLDLRRPEIQKNIALRFAVSQAVREYLNQNNFMDIETPFLIKSTPEGARDFVVPSRLNPNQFYALPQSPQTFKQLLMVSGYDRYYQIVKCFRDEDLRSDRQPEFTQIDCEMSFVNQDDVLRTFEGLIKHIISKVKNIQFAEPIPKLTWEQAMWLYGNDKPDLRFEMKITSLKKPSFLYPHYNDASEIINQINFPVFQQAETMLAIVVNNAADYSRKQLDELTEWVKRPQLGMKGLSYIKYIDAEQIKSSFEKFCDNNTIKKVVDRCQAQPGDLILILSGTEDLTRKAISELRLEMGKRLQLRDVNKFCLCWVVDFPLFEFDPEENRWVARHHPFTSPKSEEIDLILNNDPKVQDINKYIEHPYYQIKANAYDIVLNGNEIGGGSIRIFQRPLQEAMFEALGLTPDEVKLKFGFLLSAFDFGAPPHGGIAFGLDRICSILGGSESIRDFIAFPKNNSGRDVMLDSPSNIDKKQLNELRISLT